MRANTPILFSPSTKNLYIAKILNELFYRENNALNEFYSGHKSNDGYWLHLDIKILMFTICFD